MLFALLRLMLYPKRELVSSLPRTECVRRLREETAIWRASNSIRINGIPVITFGGARPKETKPVYGNIYDEAIRLQKRSKGYNSFQPFLFAQLEEEGNKTRFHCYFGEHPAVVIFMCVWMLLIAVMSLTSYGEGGAVRISVPFLFTGTLHGWWVLASSGLVLAIGFGMVVFSHYSARGEEEFLLDFLSKTIDAKKEESLRT
jgi:hypothetical protein